MSVHHCAAKTCRPDLRAKARIITAADKQAAGRCHRCRERERERKRERDWKEEHKRRIHALVLTILWKNHDDEEDASDGAEEGRHDWSVTSGVCVCVCAGGGGVRVPPSHLWP